MLCHWKVKAWSTDSEGGEESEEWSAPALWRMGILQLSGWVGEWISFPGET